MSQSFINPETYIKIGDEISVMWRSTHLQGFTGAVLEIGEGEYGYRTFFIQKSGSGLGIEEVIGVPENQAVFSVRRGDCWVNVPLPLQLEEANEKEVRRLTNERKRIEKHVPLFADQIEIPCPDPERLVAAFHREHGFKLARDHAEAMQCNELRAQVEARCSPEDFEYLLGRRGRYPENALYGSHFWRRQLEYIQQHSEIERIVLPPPLLPSMNVPWLKLDSMLTWKTAPNGPTQVKVLWVGPKVVMCKIGGDPNRETVWLKPDDFAESPQAAAA